MVYRYLEEYLEMPARNRQYIIGEELPRLASEEYLGDIMQHLKYMEVGRNEYLASVENNKTDVSTGRDTARH